jgi:hypothetical protein
LKYIEQAYSYDYTVESFYLATDLTLFILGSSSINVVNATNYYQGEISYLPVE